MLLIIVMISLVAAQTIAPPCFWPANQQQASFNSDGSGYDVKLGRSFSTSQNYGYSITPAGGRLIRWQNTRWFLPHNSKGQYDRITENFLYHSEPSSSQPLAYSFVQDGNGTVSKCTKLILKNVQFYNNDTYCVPQSWVPLPPQDDTFAVGNINVTTWSPITAMLFPQFSILTDVNGVPFQFRLRQNGHYLLLLSIENIVDSVDPAFLTIPTACSRTTTTQTVSPLFFFPPFWDPIPQ